MAEQYVGKTAEFKDGDRRINLRRRERDRPYSGTRARFYAYSNFCLHQGGPACEDSPLPRSRNASCPTRTSQGLYFSDSEMHFVCPWHGYEYDMKTGECVSDRKAQAAQIQGGRERG